MTLRAIVSALGGDLYANGSRASIPAPGHSQDDRSVSLLLENGRLIIHSFGARWQDVLDDLRRRRLVGATASSDANVGGVPARPDAFARRARARALWNEGVLTGPAGLVARHLRIRAITWSSSLGDLLEHPAAPLSIYRDCGRTVRAMMAAVREPGGDLTAVELTYLAANGRRASTLKTSRKTVGVAPPGSAVRLAPIAPAMVVAEGVATTLSAMARFDLPGWALLSANNLSRWRPPSGVDRVLIAADRGAAGEGAALALEAGLGALGIDATIVLPPLPWTDWNEVGQAAASGREEGR